MKRITRYSIMVLAAQLIPLGYAAAKPPDKIALVGEEIFRDVNLSKNANQSCMTCHDPSAGFADPDNKIDPLIFPVSEGSIAGLFGGRNAPSAAYAGFSPIFYYDAVEGLYIGGMFWDGRATGLTLGDPLAEQALGPFLNPVEMALSSKAEVIGIIEQSSYKNLFLQAFGNNALDDIDTAYDNVGRAIAAFERTNAVNSFSSTFDRFWAEQGRDVSQFGVDANGRYIGVPTSFSSKTFTSQQARGLALFNAVDKGKCALCHLTTNYQDQAGVTYPPLFTDFTYDNLGIPVNDQIAVLAGAQPIDYGLGARTAELIALTPNIKLIPMATGTPDGGKVLIAKSEAGKFKVPTLRNVGVTAPYGHNGYFVSLENITNFYNTRDIGSAGWPKPEVELNVNKQELGKLGLTLEEEAAIVAFMQTLTD